MLAFHEVNELTDEGAKYLKAYRKNAGDNRPVFWTPKEAAKSTLHAHHRWLVAEIFANLIGGFRLAGGVTRLALAEDQLKSHIYTGQTYLDDIEPDGLLIVQFGSHLKSYLIEADTGSQNVGGEMPNRFELKIDKYGRYLKERFVADPFFQGIERPQVIVVTEKPRRVEHLKQATQKLGGRHAYWFAHLDAITPPTGQITDRVWLVPTMDGPQQLATSGLV